MAELKDWSATAASNNSAPPDGWPEGMSFSNVNNTARENMAVLARWFADNNGSLTSTGSANAYLLAANRTVTAYAAGDTYCFKANFTNTGAATVNVDSVGAKAILWKTGSAIVAGQIISGGMYWIVYDGANFQLMDVKPTFESSEITLTSGAVSAVNHLLGGVPNVLTPVLRCKTAEFGYVANDEIPLNNVRFGFLISVAANSTAIKYAMHNGDDTTFSMEVNYQSGIVGASLEPITLANWRLVIRAARV